MITDFLGRPVKEGDYIFYSTTGRYSESRIGRIIKLGKVYPTIEIIRGSRHSLKKKASVRNDFILIDPPVKVGD